MAIEPALLVELQEKYQVGEKFARTFISTRYSSDFSRSDLDAILAKMPDGMWFEFAISTNLRGQGFMSRIEPFLQKKPHRALDVGAGYGGFTVAAAKAGMEAIGVEINEWLAGLAKANLADHGMDDCILVGDILDPDLVERLGRFDLISCNDVIEHVNDAWLALKHMTGMLNPGGSLFLEIPNKDHTAFIASDGHFSLFGLTLLPHEQAEQYHTEIFHSDYSVGEYYELDEYLSQLQALGCTAELLPVTGFVDRRRVLLDFAKSFREYFRFRAKHRSKLPGKVRSQLDNNYWQYSLKFALDGLKAVFSRRARRQFKLRYAPPFWFIQAVKGP